MLTGQQLSEWEVYYHIEPWGEQRADFRAGQVCATVANYAGKRRMDDIAPAHPSDFMPSLDQEPRPIKKSGPVLLADPAEHAKLMRQVLFKAKEQ